MNLVRKYIYNIVYWPVLFVMSLWHFPRFTGRKNMPQGPAVICCNHSGLADPVWVVLAIKEKLVPWIMAKKTVMDIPVLGAFLGSWGAFGVDRDGTDINAVKKSLKVLRNGEKLLIFPEGTRIRKGKQVEAKAGAIMIAARANVPVVPVYLTGNRKLFQPIRCIIGAPYQPEFASKHPTSEELQLRTRELMEKIYDLGKQK